MVDYIRNILDHILEYMKGESETPTAQHIFDIAEYATKLSRTDAYLLHHFVSQLLHISKRTRPDIQL